MITTIRQGENFNPCIKFTYKKTGAPVDLSGCTAYSQMKDKPGGNLVATAICEIDGMQGRISVVYSSEDTENIPVGKYGYDVWLIPNGDESEKRPVWTEEVEVIGRYTDNFGA